MEQTDAYYSSLAGRAKEIIARCFANCLADSLTGPIG